MKWNKKLSDYIDKLLKNVLSDEIEFELHTGEECSRASIVLNKVQCYIDKMVEAESKTEKGNKC